MTQRRSRTVPAGLASIETIVEGEGPAIAILPSLGRDGLHDFDEVAALLAAAGAIGVARRRRPERS